MVSRTIEIVEENGIVPAVDSVRFNPACAVEILVATHSNLRCIRDQTPFVVLGGILDSLQLGESTECADDERTKRNRHRVGTGINRNGFQGIGTHLRRLSTMNSPSVSSGRTSQRSGSVFNS